ncbi:MAG: hypothetical protein ACRBDL_08135 [Alphaproteobacteria bacterium]
MGVDKFSWALKKGFNELNQVRSVSISQHSGEKLAIMPFFSFSKTGSDVKVGDSFGFHAISEQDLDVYRNAYKQNGSALVKEMLRQVERAFDMVDDVGLEQANETFRQETEKFFQTYIADEVITQKYNPIAEGIEALEKKDVPSEDRFLHLRHVQRLKGHIGTERQISEAEVRKVWDIELE